MRPSTKPRFHALQCTTAPKAQNEGPSTVGFPIRQLNKMTLLHMPVEIVENIFFEWAKLEWCAPAVARQVCRQLKDVTDTSPRLWSKLLILPETTAENVHTWLRRAKAVPQEIYIKTENIFVIMAALCWGKDASSLIYPIPEAPDPSFLATLLGHMSQLRHLRIDGSGFPGLQLDQLFKFCTPPYDGHFPRITVLHLLSVHLDGFDITVMRGLFSTVRKLGLDNVANEDTILDLITACQQSLQELRVNGGPRRPIGSLSPDRDRISLPKLNVLIVDYPPRIIAKFDAPNLRLIYANLFDLSDTTGPFGSVVEWTTRWSWGQHPDITDYLRVMPKLQYLVVCENTVTLKSCFELIRDDDTICPHLRSIEVANRARTYGDITVDADLKEYLQACVAHRAATIPDFSLQFIKERWQEVRLEKYYTIQVCHFTVYVSLLLSLALQYSFGSFEEAMTAFDPSPPVCLV
jgi:hypothetical protein